MKRINEFICTGLMLLLVSGGALMATQKKDDQKVPPKESRRVHVEPKKDRDNGGRGDHRGDDKKKP